MDFISHASMNAKKGLHNTHSWVWVGFCPLHVCCMQVILWLVLVNGVEKFTNINGIHFFSYNVYRASIKVCLENF